MRIYNEFPCILRDTWIFPPWTRTLQRIQFGKEGHETKNLPKIASSTLNHGDGQPTPPDVTPPEIRV